MKPKYKPRTRVNERIGFFKLMVIDSDGKQIGVLPREEALRRAFDKGLDLVEIVPTARPPICKIMDYGKYKYDKHKSEKHKHKAVQTKEIKLGMNIQEVDILVKLKQAEKFLAHGNKVRAKLRFRGREIIYANRGKDILLNFANSLSDGVIEQAPRIDGKIATVIIAPKHNA